MNNKCQIGHRPKIQVKSKSIRIGEIIPDPTKTANQKVTTLVDAMKLAQQHLDNGDGGVAWDVLEEALEATGEK